MRGIEFFLNEDKSEVDAIIADIKKKFKKPDEQDIAGYIFDNDLIGRDDVISAINKTFKIKITDEF